MTENSSLLLADVGEILPDIYRVDDYLAAGLIFLIATSGIGINLWNFSLYRRETQTITLLILSRIICDIIVSTMFLIYVMPVVLFALTDVYSGYWNRISDLTSSWAYMFIVNLEPIISTNRLIAIFYPMAYERIFRKRFTIGCLLAILITSSISILPDLFGYDCVYSFDYTWLAWGYPLSPCGDIATTYFFLLQAYVCNGVTFLINIIISLRLVVLSCVWNKIPSTSRRQRTHIRFFVQSCLQFFVFLIDLCMNTFFSEPESRLVTFVYYTLIWMSLHTVDGFIIFFFRFKSVKSRDRGSVHFLRSRVGSVSQIGTKY